MTEQPVTIASTGLKLSGVVHVPSGVRSSERRAAFLVLHGFGSNKKSGSAQKPPWGGLTVTLPNAPDSIRSLTGVNRAAMKRSPLTLILQMRDEFAHA